MVSCLTCCKDGVPISAATTPSFLWFLASPMAKADLGSQRGAQGPWGSSLEIHWGCVIFGADDDFCWGNCWGNQFGGVFLFNGTFVNAVHALANQIGDIILHIHFFDPH